MTVELGNVSEPAGVGRRLGIKEVDEKDLSVKITCYVDVPDWSKKLSDELDELLLHEIATRRGYVKERVCHDDGRWVFRCDACGAFVKRSAVMDCVGDVPIRYCPNCGAKVVTDEA